MLCARASAAPTGINTHWTRFLPIHAFSSVQKGYCVFFAYFPMDETLNKTSLSKDEETDASMEESTSSGRCLILRLSFELFFCLYGLADSRVLVSSVDACKAVLGFVLVLSLIPLFCLLRRGEGMASFSLASHS